MSEFQFFQFRMQAVHIFENGKICALMRIILQGNVQL